MLNWQYREMLNMKGNVWKMVLRLIWFVILLNISIIRRMSMKYYLVISAYLMMD